MKTFKRVAGFFYYIYSHWVLGDSRKALLGLWFFKGGDDKYLIDYALTKDSVVFDVGGYKGVFSDRILSKYEPIMYIFEPVFDYSSILEKKYENKSNIHVFAFGLAGSTRDEAIGICGDSSSLFIDTNNKEVVSFVDIKEFMDGSNIDTIELLSINIEGGEYELLDRIIDTGLINKVKFLQVQFHKITEEHNMKREGLVERILSTHEATFSFPFVWEGFKKRS